MTTKIQQFLAECRERRRGVGAYPWHICGNGECSCVTIMDDHAPVCRMESGEWGDEYPALRDGADGKPEAYMEKITYGEVPIEMAKARVKYVQATCCPTTGTAKRTEEALAEAVRALGKLSEPQLADDDIPMNDEDALINMWGIAEEALSSIERILEGKI